MWPRGQGEGFLTPRSRVRIPPRPFCEERTRRANGHRSSNPASRSGRAKRGRPSGFGSNPATPACVTNGREERTGTGFEPYEMSGASLGPVRIPPRPWNRNSTGSSGIHRNLSRIGGFAFVQSLNAGWCVRDSRASIPGRGACNQSVIERSAVSPREATLSRPLLCSNEGWLQERSSDTLLRYLSNR